MSGAHGRELAYLLAFLRRPGAGDQEEPSSEGSRWQVALTCRGQVLRSPIDSVDFAFNDEPIEDPSEGDRQSVPHIGVVEAVTVNEARITLQGTVDGPAALGRQTLELYFTN